MKKRVIVMGAGPGGYVAAVHAAKRGLDVTVVEKAGPGGVCLRHGCIPMEALFHSVRTYKTALGASGLGVTCPEVNFDYSKMTERKDDVVALNERGIEALLKKHGVKLVRGTAKLLSPSRVEVTGTEGPDRLLEAEAVIAATGSSSVVPPFAEPDGETIFDCEGALALKKLPGSCIVLGGGVLGCEFASLFRDLGVEVAVVERLPSLLPAWDADLSRMLARSFSRRSIRVMTGVSVEDIRRDEDTGTVSVAMSSGETLTAESCLLALGRKPNTADIGLENTGVVLRKEGRRGIVVNGFMETSAPGLYAVGDVTGIRMLAHVASVQGITAVDSICGDAVPMRYEHVPECFRGEPELSMVGTTERDAAGKGIDVAVGKVYYRSLGAAHALGATDGFVKAVVESDSGRVLGIHICGRGAREMSAEASVIVANELTVDDIEYTVHAHPSLAEILKEAILAAKGGNVHG